MFCCSDDFTAFADICFRELGNKVKFWSTINEPNMSALGGYDLGFMPPEHCSAPFGHVNCSRGNSSTEPYIAVHNMLLAHASTARLYKQKYKVRHVTNTRTYILNILNARFTSLVLGVSCVMGVG